MNLPEKTMGFHISSHAISVPFPCCAFTTDAERNKMASFFNYIFPPNHPNTPTLNKKKRKKEKPSCNMRVFFLLLILKRENGISRSVREAQVRAGARRVAFDACVAARAEHAAGDSELGWVTTQTSKGAHLDFANTPVAGDKLPVTSWSQLPQMPSCQLSSHPLNPKQKRETLNTCLTLIQYPHI